MPELEIPDTPSPCRQSRRPFDVSTGITLDGRVCKPVRYRSRSKSREKKFIAIIKLDEKDDHTAPIGSQDQSASAPIDSRSDLTWHSSEITGHFIDKSHPDDADGLGLNGVGFQPSTANMLSRKEKRRVQVESWKRREERELRWERVENRRRRDTNDHNEDKRLSSPHKMLRDERNRKRGRVRWVDDQ